jgi:hypothetical protein
MADSTFPQSRLLIRLENGSGSMGNAMGFMTVSQAGILQL